MKSNHKIMNKSIFFGTLTSNDNSLERERSSTLGTHDTGCTLC